MVEQLICNQQVGGSSPSTGSTNQIEYGRVPEWPKGADCKSVAQRFDGSNPSSPTTKKAPCKGAFLVVRSGLAAESSAKAPKIPQDRRKFSSCKGLKSAGSVSALAYVRDYFSASTTRRAFVTKAHGNSRAKPEVCKADPKQSRGGFAEASTTKVTFCRQCGDALVTNPSSSTKSGVWRP